MIIKSHVGEYELKIEKQLSFMDSLLKRDNALIVIDKKVFDIYKDSIFKNINIDNVFFINAYETEKTVETALKICELMTNINAKRNAWLISIGGGITQDVTGFAANILYRGVNWAFVPTTLLAACDSCIGGKTSLNYLHYKNLLGTFFPPKQIFVCSEFFKSLSDGDYESGLGEVVKFNIIAGKDGLNRIEHDIDALISRENKVLDCYVERSLEFKKTFIEKDEFDRNERIKLNFAHTFGHAYESMSNYAIPHGTAVAMGTIVANSISVGRSMLTTKTSKRIESVLIKIIHVDIAHISLDFDKIIAAMRNDKKQTGDSLTAVLLDENMDLTIHHDIRFEEIVSAFQHMYDLLSEK